MNELYESVDKNELYFKYVGETKDVSFYEYMDSEELFNDSLKKKEFLKRICELKMGRKTPEQEEVVNNLEKFYHSREEVFNFFRDYAKMVLDAGYNAKQDETKGADLKY